MSNNRKGIRVGLEADRGPKMEIMVNGETVEAYGGETVATAMLAAGHWTFQTHEQRPLGVFCNIGVCHSCLVTIDGVKRGKGLPDHGRARHGGRVAQR